MKLVSFETISALSPILDADRIEMAHVQGWKSVVMKGEYQVGDKVIFVPIDTVIKPAEWNKFLWNKEDPTRHIRIKTKKLRGAISQGVIFPCSIVENVTDPAGLATTLGIYKYERPIPAHLSGQVAGDFPTYFLSKTDEDNLLSNPTCLEELKQCKRVVATIKLDGSSGTFIKDATGTLRVCSRNLELKETDSNTFWQQARKYKLEQALKPDTAIQGEVVGPGIQGNPLGLAEVELYVFNFKKLSTGEYVDVQSMQQEFALRNIKVVPQLWSMLQSAFKHETIDSLQQFVNGLKYPNGKPAEGVVLRGLTDEGATVYSKTLQKMLSVKIINQNYVD